jgi:hypothetical protein
MPDRRARSSQRTAAGRNPSSGPGGISCTSIGTHRAFYRPNQGRRNPKTQRHLPAARRAHRRPRLRHARGRGGTSSLGHLGRCRRERRDCPDPSGSPGARRALRSDDAHRPRAPPPSRLGPRHTGEGRSHARGDGSPLSPGRGRSAASFGNSRSSRARSAQAIDPSKAQTATTKVGLISFDESSKMGAERALGRSRSGPCRRADASSGMPAHTQA